MEERRGVMEHDEYYDDLIENSLHENCPKCGKWYDDIGFDYQYCKACGWDADNERFGESIEPTDRDYLNGDADILTGRWN